MRQGDAGDGALWVVTRCGGDDLSRSVEQKSYEDNGVREEDEVEDDADMHNAAEQSEVEVRNDYEYHRNSFVVVKPDLGEASSSTEATIFWIGKVSESEKNNTGQVVSLKVHWHELTKSTDVFTGRYCASFLCNGNVAKRKPWTDLVSSDAVMVTFESLTRKGQLPVAVQKYLRREYPTIANGDIRSQ